MRRSLAVVVAGLLAATSGISGQAARKTPSISKKRIQRVSGTNGPILIAAVGDMACGPSEVTTPTTCRQMSVSDLVVKDPKISWFLTLGDNQYPNGSAADYAASYDKSYGRVKAKTKPVPGNHEYDTAGAGGYFSYFGTSPYYSFDVGASWHVVALNSNCSFVFCGDGSVQLAWLKADLANSSRPCTIAYWHHPRFSSSSTHGDDPNVQPFWDALSQANAEVVLNGHDHTYERFDPQNAAREADPKGIHEFVVGTGGKGFYPFGAPKPHSAVRIANEFGILKLTLKNAAYDWQFVNEAGAVLDKGTGRCQ